MKHFLILQFLFVTVTVFAQKQGNVWYFGDGAGVHFNGGTPAVLLDGALKYGTRHSGAAATYCEGMSVVADSSGNVLLYTNGQTVWNSKHEVMPNGDSLFGNFSSSQSSVIIPVPGSSQFFNVFTVGDFFEDWTFSRVMHGFRYSVVDMCLDSALGDVIPHQKNLILIDSFVTEKVAAVRHSNGMDYWVLTHKLYTDEFYAYLITSAGITDTVITHIGSVNTKAQGQLKISPNGRRLASAIGAGIGADDGILEVYDLDNTTGVVSNFKPLVTKPQSQVYGVEFSPDNSKLFCTFDNLGISPETGIFQYDLNAGGGNIDSINSSKTKVYSQLNITTLKGLQLAPDGKIYMVEPLNANYLMAIDSPNNYGAFVSARSNAVYLGGRRGSYSLPTIVAGYSYSNGLTASSAVINLGGDTMTCNNHPILLNSYVAGATSYIWQDSSTADTYLVTASGDYSVTVFTGGCAVSDVIRVNLNATPVVNVNASATVFCASDSLHICADATFASYFWNTGETTKCIDVVAAGNYYLTVTDQNNCTAASNRLAVSVFSPQQVSISVKGDTLSAYNAITYQWYLDGDLILNATDSIYIANQPGLYSVAVTDSNGCRAVSSDVVFTALNEIDKAAIFQLYPNPANDQLNIITNSEMLGSELTMYSINGQVVSIVKLQAYNYMINTENYQPGVYIAELKVNGVVQRTRWVKM